MTMFDLLVKDSLSKEEIKRVKKLAQTMLAKIKARIHELDHCLCSLLERLNIRFCNRSALLDIIQERVRIAHELSLIHI